jgi:uncharacterized protein YegL
MMNHASSGMLLAFLTIAGLLGWPRPAAAQGKSPDNIVVILDASGSMREGLRGSKLTKMAAAKQALLQVMQKVPKGTQVGLLVFSAANLKNDWAYPLGPLDRAQLEAAIKLPQPHGDTPLGAYLKKGADSLLQQRERQHGYGTFRLLVVTDGEAQDMHLVNAHLPDILSRGITVDVIGVDMKADHALATRVHSYRRANDPEALTRAVAAAFAEIGSAKDDTAGAEAFAAIQPLPDEMAKAMLAALAPPGNHPIGERPAKAASTAADGPRGAAPPAPRPPVPARPGPAGGGGGWAGVMFVLVAAVLAAGWLARKSQQRRGKP